MRLMRVFTRKRADGIQILAEYKSPEGKRVKRVVGIAQSPTEIRTAVVSVAVPDRSRPQ